MKKITLTAGLPLIAIFLNGCSLTPTHNVDVSKELINNPINKIYVFDPIFPDKIPQRNGEKSVSRPTSLLEMASENQKISSEAISSALKTALSKKMVLVNDYVPDTTMNDWAKDVAKHLAKGQIPLNVEPMSAPIEYVLIVAVHRYGYEDLQFMTQVLWFHPTRYGKEKWDHTCHLIVMLVRTRDGAVLLTSEHENFTPLLGGEKSPLLLKVMTTKTATMIANDFPTKN